MSKKSYPLSKVYQLLEPGPVTLVTTARKGKPNVMTMTWHMMVDFNPSVPGSIALFSVTQLIVRAKPCKEIFDPVAFLPLKNYVEDLWKL